MNKLEELGGLEAVKAEAKERDRIPDGQLLYALIEHIESLTSEREALKKRVETSIQMLSENLAVNTALQRMTSNLESQLQASQKRVEELEHSWKCFRCGELFTEYEKAAGHFNGDFCEDEEPWCQFVKRMEAAEERVEELERKLAEKSVLCTQSIDDGNNLWGKHEDMKKQLQAARKLADAVKLWHNRQAMHSFKLEDCNHLVCAKARDFLKMLEG